MHASPAQRAALDEVTAQLAAAAGPALPGTLTVRAYACGKQNCRCHADPPLFDNARKMRTLLNKPQELTLAIIEASPRQKP